MSYFFQKLIPLIFYLLLAIGFLSEAASENIQNSLEEPPITIGLIHFSHPLSKDMDFEPTLKYLQEALSPRKIVATVYSSEKLEELIKSNEIDFFFASSGFYWRMMPFGAINIASIVIPKKENPNKGAAGTFFTRIDRDDIKTLEDMRNKSMVFNYETAFHGHRIGLAEIANHGWDPNNFFSREFFVGEDGILTVNSILAGEGDIGRAHDSKLRG